VNVRFWPKADMKVAAPPLLTPSVVTSVSIRQESLGLVGPSPHSPANRDTSASDPKRTSNVRLQARAAYTASSCKLLLDGRIRRRLGSSLHSLAKKREYFGGPDISSSHAECMSICGSFSEGRKYQKLVRFT